MKRKKEMDGFILNAFLNDDSIEEMTLPFNGTEMIENDSGFFFLVHSIAAVF